MLSTGLDSLFRDDVGCMGCSSLLHHLAETSFKILSHTSFDVYKLDCLPVQSEILSKT